MNNKKMTIGLIAFTAFQFFVLIGMYVLSELPLLTGEEIRLKTVPVDPRSMFRGNYARLKYDLSEVSAEHFSGEESLRKGEVVYVSLKKNNKGMHELQEATLTEPLDGVFLRGRIHREYYEKDEADKYQVDRYQVKYGIEAFFAPKSEALALEDDLRDGGEAILMVSSSGKAYLKDIVGTENQVN